MVKKILHFFILFAALFGTDFSGIAATNFYTVHGASYKTSGQASAHVESLTARGYPAFFTEVKSNNKEIWYRVCSGKYEKKEKAMQVAEEMVKKKVFSNYFIFAVSGNQVIQGKEKNIKLADSSRDNAGGLIEGKQEANPSKEKQRRKNDWAQVVQENKLRESSIKKDAIIAEMKTGEKIQNVPRALIDKKFGKFKEPEQFYAEREEDNSGSPLYDKALGELKEKKYDKALVTFKEFVARPDTRNDLGEKALRHMADCHFFLGEKGNKDHLPLAVQFYKNTLQSFPDEKRENAAVYFRLAKAYECLNNYYEAMKNYESLLSKYPQSVYIPEASFKIGLLLHKLGKYGPASDKLIAYLLKYRGGAFSKQAFYLVADCYYRMQQSAGAEVWFRDAQKKWPDFTGVPKDVIWDMGLHKYALRNYGEASRAFSFYANVYPNDEKIKEVLLSLAHSYRAADQISAALSIYNLIINKYPESREAAEGIMGMASLGIDRPGYKVFFAAGNFQYYKAPLEAYNLLLTNNKTGEIAENALLQKGNALHKVKQDRAAIDTYLEFLKKHPQSKMANEARKSLKQASVALIDESYRKNDYLTASDIYFKVYGVVPLQPDEYETVDKIAVSLRNVGLIDDSIQLLKKYQSISKDAKTAVKVRNKIAEVEMVRGKDNKAEKVLSESLAQTSSRNNRASLAAIKNDVTGPADLKRAHDTALSQSSSPDNRYWSMIQMGQDYLKKGNHAEAQKIFARIKTESGPESFWTKIVDYCVADREWWNKYGEYLKK